VEPAKTPGDVVGVVDDAVVGVVVVGVVGVVVVGVVVVGVVVGVVVVGVVVGVVVVGVVALHVEGTVMVSASRVTAAFRARIRPSTVAAESRVAEVNAMRVPTNVLPDPSVAELPTVQNTLHACAPPSRRTTLPEPVMRLEEAWKMYTPFPSRTSGPAAVMFAVAAAPKA
jgi:hypothetical protein